MSVEADPLLRSSAGHTSPWRDTRPGKTNAAEACERAPRLMKTTTTKTLQPEPCYSKLSSMLSPALTGPTAWATKSSGPVTIGSPERESLALT
jgi:hypothetical protein